MTQTKTQEDRIKRLEFDLKLYKILYYLLLIGVLCIYLTLGKYWNIF